VNTAPGFPNRADTERAFAAQPLRVKEGVAVEITEWSEVYTVRDSVWKAAGMEPYGGCLCIGCLEKRLGRKLRPKDFPCRHPLNSPILPGTSRLMERRCDPEDLAINEPTATAQLKELEDDAQ
jgi:hypothetical protein